MTNEDTSLEKYTSHTLFLEGLRKGCERVDVGYVREGSWRRNRLPYVNPKFLCIIAALLPHSAGLLNRSPEGPSPLSGAGSHCGTLSPTATGTRIVTATRTELCLPRTPTYQTVCGTRLYICLRPPASRGLLVCTEFNPSTGQGDIPISSTGCTFFLIDGSVQGQYVTYIYKLSDRILERTKCYPFQ